MNIKMISHQYQEFSFSSSQKNKRYKIISLEMRTLLLNYVDTKINREYKEKITAVAQDQFVVSNMDSMQACYIGMQAGYASIKQGNTVFDMSNSRPVLKVI